MANQGHFVMQTKIILYLDDTSTNHADWAVLSENGAIQQVTIAGRLSDLTAIAGDSHLTVIIPAQDVLLTQANVPKLSQQRLLQALPFALEDQLLTDVNELHFAVGAYQANNTLPVSVVTQQKMRAWLNLLKEFSLSPTIMIPASLALPLTENHWQVAIKDDVAIIRMDLYNGFACDKNNLAPLLALKLNEELQKPEAIHVRNYTLHPLAIQIIGTKYLETNVESKQFIEDLSLCAQSPALNLLQDMFRPKHKAAPSKKIWRFAAYAVAAWLGLIFFSNIVSFFILHRQASVLETQINQIYKRNFPQATAVVAPKERMTRKLDELNTQGNKNPLLLWLGRIGKSMAQVSNIRLLQLDFRNSQLNLAISAPNFESVDKFTQSLIQQGLTVKQQHVETSGDTVKSNLSITAGAAT
jgi:general secretion pathway protein L